ncbi:hypothetical protein [Deinococcus actinosclerus]|uniref:hypothetical protein n=1 Tax=Deinococcus actinosclerus TaxID=1768108 RepID=UPI000A7EDBB1|nr:hypothetical protein [Deinococcus actinosclerus]
MKKIVFTIVNGDYMAYANALRQSVAHHLHDFDFRIILLEEENSFDFKQIILAKNLFIDDFYHRAFYYNITELATSIKPDAIIYFMNEGYDQILYLDPDIVFYSYPHDICDSLQENNIVLTPHTNQIMSTLDGKRPNELDLLRTGTYNLGFIGVRNSVEGRKFAEWWSSRLKYLSFEDYLNGQYTDQKWINLATEIFSGVFILKHEGYNVAYWNIENRFLRYDNENNSWKVNGRPLVFFHFSGFKSTIDSISKNQTRASFDSRQELRELFSSYKKSLDSFINKSSVPYSYGKFKNKNNISGLQRNFYFYIYVSHLYKLDINPFDFTWSQILELRNRFSRRAPIMFHINDKEKKLLNTKNPVLKMFFKFAINKLVDSRFTSFIDRVHLITNRSNYARIVENGSSK